MTVSEIDVRFRAATPEFRTSSQKVSHAAMIRLSGFSWGFLWSLLPDKGGITTGVWHITMIRLSGFRGDLWSLFGVY